MVLSQVNIMYFPDYDKGCFDVRIYPWISDTSVENGTSNNISYPTWMYVPMYQKSSMWELCDTIPSKRLILKIKIAYVDLDTQFPPLLWLLR